MSDCNLTATCVNGVWTGDGACFVNCCDVPCPDSCDSVEFVYLCGPISKVNYQLVFPPCQCDKAECAEVKIKVENDGPCGIKYENGTVFSPPSDGCCCVYNDPYTITFTATLNDGLGGFCDFYIDWPGGVVVVNSPVEPRVIMPKLCSAKSQTRPPCDPILIATNSYCGDKTGFYWPGDPDLPNAEVCSCCFCEVRCNTGASLWMTRITKDKIILQLNKKELISKLNKIKRYRINKRNKRNIRRNS